MFVLKSFSVKQTSWWLTRATLAPILEQEFCLFATTRTKLFRFIWDEKFSDTGNVFKLKLDRILLHLRELRFLVFLFDEAFLASLYFPLEHAIL